VIRHFGVAQDKSLTPLTGVKGQWDVCTPDKVPGFTAVGYFFGRDLHKARRVPIGLIHSSWGGTPAEAWTSEAGLRALPDFADTPEMIKTLIADPDTARRRYEEKLETWFVAYDAGSSRAGNASGLERHRAGYRRMEDDAGARAVGGVQRAGPQRRGLVAQDVRRSGGRRGRRRRAAVGDGRRRRHDLDQRREGRRHSRLQPSAQVRGPGRGAQARAQRRRRARARHRRGGGIWGEEQRCSSCFPARPPRSPIDLAGPGVSRSG
jgi:hypothetical protein